MSRQLERLPASGLTIEFKEATLNRECFGLAAALSVATLIFFLLICVVLNLLPLSFWQMLCLFLLLFFYCQNLFRKHFLLNHPLSINRIIFTEIGWCYVQLNSSQVFKADIEYDTVLTEHLVILNLRAQDADAQTSNSLLSRITKLKLFNQYSIFLTADRLGRDKFRNIKRHLRLINFHQT